jgi:hypothetical protein
VAVVEVRDLVDCLIRRHPHLLAARRAAALRRLAEHLHDDVALRLDAEVLVQEGDGVEQRVRSHQTDALIAVRAHPIHDGRQHLVRLLLRQPAAAEPRALALAAGILLLRGLGQLEDARFVLEVLAEVAQALERRVLHLVARRLRHVRQQRRQQLGPEPGRARGERGLALGAGGGGELRRVAVTLQPAAYQRRHRQLDGPQRRDHVRRRGARGALRGGERLQQDGLNLRADGRRDAEPGPRGCELRRLLPAGDAHLDVQPRLLPQRHGGGVALGAEELREQAEERAEVLLAKGVELGLGGLPRRGVLAAGQQLLHLLDGVGHGGVLACGWWR